MITNLYSLLLSFFFLLKHIREEAAGGRETTKSSTIIFLTKYVHARDANKRDCEFLYKLSPFENNNVKRSFNATGLNINYRVHSLKLQNNNIHFVHLRFIYIIHILA